MSNTDHNPVPNFFLASAACILKESPKSFVADKQLAIQKNYCLYCGVTRIKGVKLRQFRLSTHNMTQLKYRYNKETCNYEKIETSAQVIFLRLLGFLTLSFIFSIGI